MRSGGGEGGSTPEADAAPADGEIWDVAIRVPAARIEDIFHAFTEQEQINAIQRVLQDRMDSILEAPAEEAA